MTPAKLSFVPILALIAGCVHSASGNAYPRYETRVAYDVEYGEVMSARAVAIEGDPSLIGVWGGAEVGRSVGDSGFGRAVGSVAGAIAGAAIEREIAAEDGLEIVIRLDENRTIAVVQAADIPFVPGDRVRVLFGPYDTARVSPL